MGQGGTQHINFSMVKQVMQNFKAAYKESLTREQRKRLMHLLVRQININEERQIESIQVQLNGHTPLELMICIAISALIIGMLNRSKIGGFDSLLVHLVGSSTTGKTTAGMLGVSLAGSPSPNEGLLQTYNGTKNAMARKLASNHGVLTVLDESTMNLIFHPLYPALKHQWKLVGYEDSEKVC